MIPITDLVCTSCKSLEDIRYHKDHDKNLCKICHDKLHREKNLLKGVRKNKSAINFKVTFCLNCLNYTKKGDGRCKIKKELIIIINNSCNMFAKIPNSVIKRNNNQDKVANKKRSARFCIGCTSNQEGFCLKYKRWAFHVRNTCVDMKTKTAE